MQNLNSTSWTSPSNARWTGGRSTGTVSAAAPRLRVWGPWAVAGLLFAVLMFSFLSVVQQSVDRAGQQQIQAETLATAESRCQGEATYGQRQSCLAALKADSGVASTR